MEKIPTAVVWLVKKLNQEIDYIPLNKWDVISDIIQEALAMEKEHLKKAFNEGSFANDEKVTFEEYYNEQYYKVVQKVKELNNNHDFNL